MTHILATSNFTPKSPKVCRPVLINAHLLVRVGLIFACMAASECKHTP